MIKREREGKREGGQGKEGRGEGGRKEGKKERGRRKGEKDSEWPNSAVNGVLPGAGFQFYY